MLKKVSLFLLFGGLGVLIELIFLNIFLFFDLIFILAKIFSLFIALSFNFMMNRVFTFSARNSKIFHQIPKYITIQSISFLVNVGVSLLVVSLLPKTIIYANIASASGILAALPVNFLGSLFWTFRK